MKKIFKPKFLDEEGQAIFELMIFLPVMLYLVSILISVGNSINASINQQKMTRGYLFHLIKGNSMGNSTEDLAYYKTNGKGVNLISPFIVGWRLEERSKESIGAYYVLPRVPIGGSSGDDLPCDEKLEGIETNKCIRIFTLYGVCGETYEFVGNSYFHGNDPAYRRARTKECKFSQ